MFLIWVDHVYSCIREDFKEEQEPKKEKEREEKGKGKDDEVEDSADRGTKEKEKEREKERTPLQEMKVIGLKMTGKEQRQKVGMMAIGPMKCGNPKAEVNGKKITTMRKDTKEGEQRKERPWTSTRSRKRTNDGKGEASPPRSRQLYLCHRTPPVPIQKIRCHQLLQA